MSAKVRELRDQHFRIEDELDDLSCIPSRRTKERRSKFQSVRKLILSHLDTEEKLVYNPMFGVGTHCDSLEHGYEGHRQIRHFLNELSRIRLDESSWEQALKNLQEHLVRIHDEEENTLFEEYERALNPRTKPQGLESAQYV